MYPEPSATTTRFATPEEAEGVNPPTVVALEALEALPLKVAVIVPAEKLPEASRSTIWLAVLELEAVMVALFA